MFTLEAVSEVSPLSPDEFRAEDSFTQSYSRLPSGRFVLRLPFGPDPSSLGTSRPIALRRLHQTEQRHRKYPHLRKPYVDFMRDYLESGHMELAPPLQPHQLHYYLPHHAVHRPEDPPEKIRIVFNASEPTSNGLSLNQLLLPGPRLQLDIWKAVLNFRLDRLVFTADIRQMFRQIEHPPADRDFLRICWRFDPHEPVQDYRLTTVTYGTASAPYLACQVLRELARCYDCSHPEAAELLRSRTYVDDVNGGGCSIEDTLKVRDQLIDLLAQGQLELRKWAANDLRLLENIPTEQRLPVMTSVPWESDEAGLKLLGLFWNPLQDAFGFQLSPAPEVSTKRQLDSQIARIFDPLGWLMPIIVYVRSIFRVVCQNDCEWDQPLPSSVTVDWKCFADQLPLLSALQIPRFVAPQEDVYLVSFADASERAYAAVIYLVSRRQDRPHISLLMSKARIAPMKALTLPRLELCAAHLLARTMKLILPQFPQVAPDRIFAFTDSTIVLSWIPANPTPVWKVFVGNRVSNLVENVSPQCWFHVLSGDNPADYASRGLRPKDLIANQQWWYGPHWLAKDQSNWPITKTEISLSNPATQVEIRARSTLRVMVTVANDTLDMLINRFSSLTKLQAVLAWVIRFGNNARPLGGRKSGQLSSSELSNALLLLVRHAQVQSFPQELKDAKVERSRLQLNRVLGLFVDQNGTLRVGGRLRQANLPDYTKHPALLPATHSLSNLIIQQAHLRNLHVGPSATHAFIRNNFWIVNGKNVVRRLLAKCNRCFSVKPQPFQPPMGQLPTDTAKPAPPFSVVGVDYAGPFQVKFANIRSLKIASMYLAVFVCFASKAVHLEVVSDLSTPAFLAAYRRFVARRGHPSVVWSENGRNFVGAKRKLDQLSVLLQKEEHRSSFIQEAARMSTEWNFIPPRAPHFGGLWEAAVKAMKRLLKVTLRTQIPTLESFNTITTQVEAIVEAEFNNSRPLTAETSSPDDLQVLTPGHFLVQRALTAPPIDPTLDQRTSHRNRWSMTQFIVLQFWRRWTKEYLLLQQTAQKWTAPDNPPNVGQVVMIAEENLPPLQWIIGRIVNLHPGPDGITRVADVSTSMGVFRRPLRKLCPLPSQ